MLVAVRDGTIWAAYMAPGRDQVMAAMALTITENCFQS
jgi:hypothetical protein